MRGRRSSCMHSTPCCNTFTLIEAGQVQARYTFIYERQVDGQWKILNHHSSAIPEAQLAHAG